MATNLVSYPFRLGPNGSVVTRPDDSPDYYAELIALLLVTHPGERAQVPLFGCGDPTFDELDAQELIYKVGIFGPPVRIVSVKKRVVSGTEEEIIVGFVPLDTELSEFSSDT